MISKVLSFSEVKQATAVVTQVLSDKNIPVNFMGSKAVTVYDDKGNVQGITLPNIPDDADESVKKALAGYADHESAHALYSDGLAGFKFRDKVIKNFGETFVKTGMTLANIFEDARIEQKMGTRYKGCKDNLNDTLFAVYEKDRPELLKAIANEDVNTMLAGTLFVYARMLRGHEAAKKIYEKYRSDFRASEAMRLSYPELFNEATRADSCQEIFDAVYRFLDEIYKDSPPDDGDGNAEDEEDDRNHDGKNKQKIAFGQPSGQSDESSNNQDDSSGSSGESGQSEQSQEQNGSDSQENQDQEQNQEGEGQGQGGQGKDQNEEQSEDEKEDSEDSENGDSEDESDSEEDSDDDFDGDSDNDSDEDGEEDDDDNWDDDQEDDGEGENEESSPNDKKLIVSINKLKGTLANLSDLSDRYKEGMENIIQKVFCEYNKTGTPSARYVPFTTDFDRIEKVDRRKAERYLAGRQDYARRFIEEANQQINVIQKQLEKHMSAKSVSLWEYGQKRGSLYGAGLVKLRTGNEAIFRKKIESRTKDVAVSLLIDCSGSMHGAKIKAACQSAYVFTSALSRMNINHEVIGFTTLGRESFPPHIWDELSEQKRKFAFAREEAINMPIFKEFGERLSPNIINGLIAFSADLLDSMANNVDGESVLIAAKRLAAQPQKRKLLIVFSDGWPNWYGSSEGVWAEAHLEEALATIEKWGVETFGIGIYDSAVENFYKNSAVLEDSLGDLGRIALGELKRFLFR